MYSSFEFFGVHFTSWCPLGCQHCFTNSSPTAKKDIVNFDLAEALGRCVLVRNPNARMVITGGEPLAFRNQLMILVRRINRLGVETTLHTNGFWGGREWVEEVFCSLIGSGLTRVNLSVDDYHLERLSLSVLQKAARVILDLEVEFRILVTFGESTIRPDNVLSLLGFPENAPIEIIPVSLARSGRAQTLSCDKFAQTDQVGWCPKLINPVLFSNGELSPCSGSAFSSICHPEVWKEQLVRPQSEDDINNILDGWEKEPLLYAISHSGPRAVHLKLLEKSGLPQLEPLSRAGGCECESCNQLFSDKRLREPLAELRKFRKNRWAHGA